ncbi:MAG: tetratricopeptide repeat protein [Deltaproteobacteria bacterium]|nr:tetratricopeptide repeat protein [Deltaproteobacteria bacterium]
MKRLWLALVIGVFLCASVHAREYMGLQPGRSTRADADRVLGKAIGSGPEDGQADYDPADHGVARLTVNFDDRGIIRSINLYPPKAYPRQKMIEWLELEAPDRMQRNADGALEEIYSAQGIILTFVPGDMNQVIQLTHFYAEKPPAAKAVSKTQAPKTQTPAVIAAGKTPYFGVSTVLTDAGEILILQVHMESPAAAAGLQVEDVLLRLGDYRMQPPVTDKAALEKAVQSPPTGTAAPLVFRRRGEKIRRTVTLTALSDSELAARKALTQEQIDLAADFYQRANQPFKAKHYREAASLLEQAYGLDARPRNHAIALGKVYRLLQRYQDAEHILALRARFDDASIVHYSLGRVAMGQQQAAKAIGHFQASIKTLSKDDDGHLDHLWLGIAYLGDKRPADADRHLKKAAALRPKAEDPFYWLGRSAEMQKRWQDARAYYDEYLEMNPQNADRAQDAKRRSEKMALAIKHDDPGYQTGRKMGEALGNALKGLLSD